MNKKFKSLLATLLIASGVLCSAKEAEEKKFEIPQNTAPGKICLLITDVGTIDTVAKTEEFLTRIKEFNVDDVPTLSEADKAANPQMVTTEINIRYNDALRKYSDREREVAARNRRMERVLEQLRNSIVGDKNKRDIVVAKNYLQSYLQPYSDYIQVIDRANTNLAEVEKAIGGNDQQDVASACVFLTVIMQDMKEESQTVQVGNTMVKRTNYTQKAVANIRDFNGNVLMACNMVATATRRRTSATSSSGYNPSDALLEEVLKQTATNVASHFLCRLNIECKGDDDFDEDMVTLTLNDKDFENGSVMLTGSYKLVAEADGYQTIRKSLDLKKGGEKTIKLKFKPEIRCTVNVKYSGDEEFDENSVELTLDGEAFENGDTVSAGKHKLIASAKGYKTIEKTFTVKQSGEKNFELKFKSENKNSDDAQTEN